MLKDDEEYDSKSVNWALSVSKRVGVPIGECAVVLTGLEVALRR